MANLKQRERRVAYIGQEDLVAKQNKRVKGFKGSKRVQGFLEKLRQLAKLLQEAWPKVQASRSLEGSKVQSGHTYARGNVMVHSSWHSWHAPGL